MAALLIFGALGTLWAGAPKPPSEPKIALTLAGLDKSGNVQNGAQTLQVTWKDQAPDEEGYRVKVSIGKPLVVVAEENFPADTTEVTLTLNTALTATTPAEASIQCWRREGAAIAASSPVVVKYTTPTLPSPETQKLNTPLLTSAVSIGDNGFELEWLDYNNSELFHQVFLYSENSEQTLEFAPFAGLVSLAKNGSSIPNPVKRRYTLRPVPGTDYKLYVRATRRASLSATDSEVSVNSNFIMWTAPALLAPTLLRANTPSDDRVELSWQDNSNNETGYEVLRSADNQETFTSLGTLGANSNSVGITVPSGSQWKWKVRPIYTYKPAGQPDSTTVLGLESAVVRTGDGFLPPGHLTATGDEGLAYTATLTWEDNSDSESGYNIETRRWGDSDWKLAMALPANVTQARVSRRSTGTLDDNQVPIFTKLETEGEHEFRVIALRNDGSASEPSNTARCAVFEGFTRLPNASAFNGSLQDGAQVGSPYSYQPLATSSPMITASNMPAGLTWNDVTQTITGVPEQSGIHHITLSADYSGRVVNTTLILRVLPRSLIPRRITDLGRANSLKLGIGRALDINLSRHFEDPDAGTTLLVETNKPLSQGVANLADGSTDFYKFKLRLYNEAAPRASDNFLAYVRGGDYNQLVFHRLLKGFVLQGGSLRSAGSGNRFQFSAQRPSPLNEPGLENTAFTLAAAKVGARSSPASATALETDSDEDHGYFGNPDSATTDFFINLGDNRSNLDFQNSGFTVFGHVGYHDRERLSNIITNLGVNDYRNENNADSNDPNLDRRLLVGNQAVRYESLPTLSNPGPQTPDSDAAFKITHIREIGPLTYFVGSDNSAIANAELLADNTLRLRGYKAGQCTITITVRDADENTLTQPISVEVKAGQSPVVISKQPVSTSLPAGADAVLRVACSGSPPLSFQWYREDALGNFLRINGNDSATTPNLILPGLSLPDFTRYKVVVSNDSGLVESLPATLSAVSAPQGGALLAAKGTPSNSQDPSQELLVVNVGSPFFIRFESLRGAPQPAVTWKRDARSIAKQSGAVLAVSAAKLTDAGIYTASASNRLGSLAASGAIRIVVIDRSTLVHEFKPGQALQLKVAAAGPNLTYRWKRNGTALDPLNPRWITAAEPILKISALTSNDAGVYTCQLGMSGQELEVQGPDLILRELQIPRLPPLSGELAPPRGAVGTSYRWQIPYETSPMDTLSWRPSVISVKGLPKGLQASAAGLISGHPLQPGSFPLQIALKNSAGSSLDSQSQDPIHRTTLEIIPLPAANAGSFIATVNPSSINQNLGGLLQLTIEDSGTYSASLNVGTEILRAAGQIQYEPDALNDGQGGNTPAYASRCTFKRANGSPLNLAFTLEPQGGYLSGQLSDDLTSTSVSGIRRYWDAIWRPCAGYGTQPSIKDSTSARYNMILQPGNEIAGLALGNQPQGSGFASMSINPAGIGTLAGMLPDGTSLTYSSFVGPLGEFPAFLLLYGKKGAWLASLDVSENLVGKNLVESRRSIVGAARWIKTTGSPTERLYPNGINATLYNILGCSYTPPAAPKLALGLPPSFAGIANAGLLLTGAKINFSSNGLPNGALRISSDGVGGNIARVVGNNTHSLSLGININVGTISGSFRINQSGINRDASFRGMLVPSLPYTPRFINAQGNLSDEVEGRSALSEGFFLLPDLQSTQKSPLLFSGRVQLQPLSLSVVSTPQTQVLRAGSLASLSVELATGAQGPFTYRWRKNGASISGASFDSGALNSTLNLGAATTAMSGTYDCEITNGAVTLITPQSPASLLVVTANVTRDPANTVPAGSSVTYSVSTDLPNPSYQWYKGTQPIEGATQSSLTLPAVTAADQGAYKVLLTNSSAPAGIFSDSNTLQVTSPP